MKKFILAILILGSFLTPKAKADEMYNSSDMFAIPICELQDYADTAQGDQDNGNEGHHLYQMEGEGYGTCCAPCGYGVAFGDVKKVINNTLDQKIGVGNIIHPKKWRADRGHVRVRRAKTSGEALQGNHYPTAQYGYRTGEYDHRS